jgi:hypothetical protein
MEASITTSALIYRLPSSIISWMESPFSVFFLQNPRNSAMTSFGSFFFEGGGDCKTATGTPCLAMIIRSPLRRCSSPSRQSALPQKAMRHTE